MNPEIKFDNQWVNRLSEAYPDSAEQIAQLAKHMLSKQERLFALIQYCAAHPELPMMRMYAEYNSALDAVAAEPPQETEPEFSDREAALLDSRLRAARTKRLRSRMKFVESAALLAVEKPQDWTFEDLISLSGISNATLYNHFPRRHLLVVAAYDHLIANG